MRSSKPKTELHSPTAHFFLTVCLKVRRHQFMGNQVIKIFAAKDDEVSTETSGAFLTVTCYH